MPAANGLTNHKLHKIVLSRTLCVRFLEKLRRLRPNLPPIHTLSLYIYISIYLSVSVSLSLCVCVCVSLSLSVSRSFSLLPKYTKAIKRLGKENGAAMQFLCIDPTIFYIYGRLHIERYLEGKSTFEISD